MKLFNRKKRGEKENRKLYTSKEYNLKIISSVRQIWILVASGFILLCSISILNEFFNIPNHLFKILKTPANWIEVTIEIGMISLISIISLIILLRQTKIIHLSRKALSESEYKYSSLVEESSDAIVIVQDTLLKVINTASTDLSGYPSDELIGKSFRELIHPDDLEFVSDIYAARIARKKDIPTSYEMKIIRKDDSFVPVEVTSTVIEYQDKPAVLAIIRDTSERKRADEQIQKDLKEKETLIQELYHRTKNNMQVICSMLDLQTLKHHNPEIKTLFKEIKNKIFSMSLVHMHLYDSKNLCHLNLKDYLNSLLNLFKRSYVDSIQNISIQTDMQDINVLMDSAVPLGLAFNELILNIIKHAFPNNRLGKIKIQSYLDNQEMIVLQVSDDGIGLPKNFDFKKDIGIGLEIMFGLVEDQLGGKVAIEKNNGLTYTITFKDALYHARVENYER